jgi:tripartite-type tricarboxylate transporter receptor subunit TctC
MNAKLVFSLVAAVACVPAGAQTYYDFPTRPVRVVVGASAGDTNDLLARIVAPPLAQFFKRPFIIDDEPGANGARAAELVARSHADGHTVLVVSAPFATTVSLYPHLPYHPQRDFAPVARIATFPQVLIVQSSLKLRTLQEFFSLLRATPGRIAIASSGTGTTSHLAAELMKLKAGWLSALHVPYRSNAQALAGLLGNHVHALVSPVLLAQAHITSGRVQALAVATANRLPSLPTVPTFAESGLKGVEASGWTGIVVPATTPYEPVVRLSVALADVLNGPTVRERIMAQGGEPVRETPEEFGRYLNEEIERWAKVVKASGIGPE